jgi:outer membrane protein, multidrug efflux system
MIRYLLFIFIVLSSCNIGPKYQVPDMQLPENWKATSSTMPRPEVYENWWELFDDAQLTDLAMKVAKNNHDLKRSLQMIIEARAAAGIKRADLFPQIDLNPNYRNILELIQLYGIPTNLVPGLQEFVRVHEINYELPLVGSYELDIWKKIYSQYDAAKIEITAKQEAFDGLFLSLSTELASHYFNLQALDRQIAITDKKLCLLEEKTYIEQRRFMVGVSDALSLLQSQKSLYDEKALLKDLQRQRALFENAIALLVGDMAPQFHLDRTLLGDHIPCIPVGLPSTLLRARPDIRQAEREMASNHKMITSRIAAFFPSFTLTGGLGASSPDLRQFMEWKSRLIEWGVDILQSIIDGGRKRNKLEETWARFRQTENNYQQTVLRALQEVEDALANVDKRKEEGDNLYGSYVTSSKSRSIAQLQFDKGLTNRLAYIDMALESLSAEMKWTEILAKRYQSLIQLIKAIGGKWDITDGEHGRKSLQKKESQEP